MEFIELHVRMCCNGCERSVRKALSKLKGIDSVDVDLARYKVTVTGYVDRKKVLKAVRSTGKRAEFWAQQHYGSSHPMMAMNNAYDHSSSQAFTRTYNYERHGYNENNGYPLNAYYPTANEAGGATSMFSDENANACSIM